ncbi:MAG: hypothetical protein RL088_2887 [Verrucomicrobiota bacterium]|jgi:hypothetical protein
MKHYLLATAAAVCLSACAGTKVTNAVIATGSTSPKAIYIRPFNVAEGRSAAPTAGLHSARFANRRLRRRSPRC